MTVNTRLWVKIEAVTTNEYLMHKSSADGDLNVDTYCCLRNRTTCAKIDEEKRKTLPTKTSSFKNSVRISMRGRKYRCTRDYRFDGGGSTSVGKLGLERERFVSWIALFDAVIFALFSLQKLPRLTSFNSFNLLNLSTPNLNCLTYHRVIYSLSFSSQEKFLQFA
jgi:hypothetical protein